MAIDVIDLRHFYHSPLGQIALQDTKRLIERLWQPRKGQTVLGFGYTTPYLDNFLEAQNPTFSFMPAQQGVLAWPSQQPSLSALVEEDTLPLSDRSIDRILLVHALESCHNPEHLLREIWRVLAADGRLLLIVPNRRGLWARFDNTPFGHGQPYTMTQLSNLLRKSLFTPATFCRGLYTPPSCSRLIQAASPVFEKIGQACLQKFSGTICIEAVKQVYAGIGIPARKKVKMAFVPSSSRPVGA